MRPNCWAPVREGWRGLEAALAVYNVMGIMGIFNMLNTVYALVPGGTPKTEL